MRKKFKGIMYYVTCCFCFVLCSVLTRYVPSSNPFLIIFFRDIFCLAMASVWILNTDVKLFNTSQLSVQAARSIFAFLGILCWIYAVKNIPLSDATALNLTVPIFSSIIAIIFLKEKIKLNRIIGIICGMAGAYIITSPDFNNFDYYYLFPLGSAFMFSIYNNLVRYLTFKNDPLTIMFYFFLFQTIICIPLIIEDFALPDIKALSIMFLIGIVACLNVYFHAKAFKNSEIGCVEAYDFTRLIFACFFGAILFDEVIDKHTIIGSLVILFTSLVVLKYEQIYPQKLWITFKRKLRGNVHST